MRVVLFLLCCIIVRLNTSVWKCLTYHKSEWISLNLIATVTLCSYMLISLLLSTGEYKYASWNCIEWISRVFLQWFYQAAFQTFYFNHRVILSGRLMCSMRGSFCSSAVVLGKKLVSVLRIKWISGPSRFQLFSDIWLFCY